MARYSISRVGLASDKFDDTKIRKRRDFAADCLYSTVYETVKSFAGLDTAWGQRAALEAIALGNVISSAQDFVGWSAMVIVQGEIIKIKREA